MITKDSIETAYSFLHQKRNVYIHSTLDWQKDDIEYAIASYADDMSRDLYDVIMLLYVLIVVKRIHNEEMVLKQELSGYKEYIQRIRYRLIPFIW
ncbi:MAG: hypothetical protein IK148_03935 [Prevotella sp.]|nr:hypothetical protein [Prevotella sp.]